MLNRILNPLAALCLMFSLFCGALGAYAIGSGDSVLMLDSMIACSGAGVVYVLARFACLVKQ